MSTAEAISLLARANLALAAAIFVVLALRLPVRRVFGARVAYGLWIAPLLAAGAALLPAKVRTVLVLVQIEFPPEIGASRALGPQVSAPGSRT